MRCPHRRCHGHWLTWQPVRRAWLCPSCGFGLGLNWLFASDGVDAAFTAGRVDISKLPLSDEAQVAIRYGQIDLGPLPGQTGTMR